MSATSRETSEAWLSQTLDVAHATPEAAVSKLLEHAIRLKASDLFLTGATQGVVVQVRQHGIVQPISILPLEMGRRVLGHVRAAAAMEYNEKRRPVDGRWIYTAADGKSVDLRIGLIPTLHGEDIAIRILNRDSGYFALEKLGMTDAQRQAYETMIDSPSGLILITGPTGSGKTVTLYSTLIRLHNGNRKINTVEDPIEYSLDGLHQSQVNPAIDLNFAELLRSVLRQNPDVIMIGEIRDEKTAQLAVHAAGTGILVFATLHSQGTAGAIQTMRSLGCHPHFLATALRGVIAQRLVRTLCPHCRTSVEVDDAPHLFDEIRPWLKDGQGTKLYGRKGCNQCAMSGYTGRTGVFEVMPTSPGLRRVIASARPIGEIREQAIAEKMMTFRQAALLDVARGQTTTEEVFRVIPPEELMVEEA